jgi:SAM-dependent methyltransferase
VIRINVGCGNKYFPGFINVDRHGSDDDVDVHSDTHPLPFTTDFADEIWAIHVFEHLHRSEAGKALYEWFRVLKPGGKLILELPCLDKIAKLIVDGEENIRLTLLGLYGDPRDPKPDMMHQWCWSKKELTETLGNVAFTNINVMEPVFHIPARDMRVEALKP